MNGGTKENPILIPSNRSITIKDLMMHTSGISYGIFGTSIPDTMMKESCPDHVDWFHHTNLKDLCSMIAKIPLLFQPGTKWHYGFNTDILGRIIEICSNQSLDDFF